MSCFVITKENNKYLRWYVANSFTQCGVREGKTLQEVNIFAQEIFWK